jgi:hypothetical protein
MRLIDEDERRRANNKVALTTHAPVAPTGATKIEIAPNEGHVPAIESPAPTKADRTRKMRFTIAPFRDRRPDVSPWCSKNGEDCMTISMANMRQLLSENR